MRISKRVYNNDTLTADERFRLLLKATGRGDHDEETKLLNTTPMKHYEGRDLRVVTRLESCERIAVCFTIMALEHSRYMLSAYVTGFQDKQDVSKEVMGIARQLKSLKMALDAFCEEWEWDPLDVMAFHPCGQREYLYAEAIPVVGDLQIHEEFYEALCEEINCRKG